MNLNKRILSIAAAGALSAGALVTFGAGAAQAAFPADPGQLTLTPATGDTNTGLTANLSESCPVGTESLVGLVTGPGITGTAVLQSSRPANATSFATSGTFGDVFQSAGVASPSGAYTVRINCRDENFAISGYFAQTVNFTPTGGAFNASYVTVVPAAATSTVLSQNTASGSFGDSVTFTADPTGTGGGSVQFKDGATNLGAAQTVTAGGAVSLTLSTLAVGSHSITAVYSGDASFAGSTSNAVTHAVAAVGTSTVVTGTGTSAQYAATTFTATVSPAVAGTVTFTEGATTLGSSAVDGAGVATLTTSTLAVGTHPIVATFAPTAPGASGSTSAVYTHTVSAFAGVSVPEDVFVTVPAGALVIALADGADGSVDLGTAQINAGGDLLTASGPMDDVKVTDTRAGDPGWVASGIVTDFTKGADAFSGFNLGWVPAVVTSSANQVGIAAGPSVTAGTQPAAGTTPGDPAVGLGASRVLATTTDNNGNGTAVLGAALNLNIPTDVPAGVYHATLTLSAI